VFSYNLLIRVQAAEAKAAASAEERRHAANSRVQSGGRFKGDLTRTNSMPMSRTNSSSMTRTASNGWQGVPNKPSSRMTGTGDTGRFGDLNIKPPTRLGPPPKAGAAGSSRESLAKPDGPKSASVRSNQYA